MPRIITALYETRAAAERALQALMETGVARDRIAIVGERHATGTEVAPSRAPASNENVVTALRDLALPREDAQLFEAGLRRGYVLVSARVEGGDIDRAVQTLEMFDPVDLDRQSAALLGGAGSQAGAGGGVDVGGPLGAGLTAGSGQGNTNLESVPGMGTMADDTSGLGTADLRTSEKGLSDQGRSAVPAGDRRTEERAGAPGVNELAAPGIENPNPDLHRREMSGVGRVRRYVRDGS